jgi:hypothetical protein
MTGYTDVVTNDTNLFTEFSKHFTVGPAKPKVTMTAAGRRRYRQATDSYLEMVAASPGSSDTQRRMARNELKRRYGGQTPAEYWSATPGRRAFKGLPEPT